MCERIAYSSASWPLSDDSLSKNRARRSLPCSAPAQNCVDVLPFRFYPLGCLQQQDTFIATTGMDRKSLMGRFDVLEYALEEIEPGRRKACG
jgi:hypothetical protein